MRRAASQDGPSFTQHTQQGDSAGYRHTGAFDPMQQAEFGSAAAASSSSYAACPAVWRTRLHRLYLRLNALELLLVTLLRTLHLWPDLLRPPQSDAMRDEMEQAAATLTPSAESSSLTTGTTQSVDADSIRSGVWHWSSALLTAASSALWPNGWTPLSFRKSVVVEPPLEPSYPPASTHAQAVGCMMLLLLVAMLNTVWLK